ncbi:hypothetical protein [Chryseobacterium indoltheticum]|uniref:hypothetical protein n=1 Tax=Chryseobacterium indoltheticum TaxID=254 RepID=UPI003F49187E
MKLANLGFTELSYAKAKDKEMKLGLDLKGSTFFWKSIRDLVNDLTNYSTNPILIEALNRTDEARKTLLQSYIDNFFVEFDAVNKTKCKPKLADPEIFGNTNLSEIKFNTTDEQVKSIVKKEELIFL